MVAFMVSLAFIIGVAVGILATAGAVVAYRVYKRPAVGAPVARILPRPVPAHLKESRILTHGTRVVFLNDLPGGREYTSAYVDEYHREPGRGNYYLVVYNGGTLAEGRKWVPDHYVWERGEKKAA